MVVNPAPVERGVIRKPAAGRLRVALVYPHHYHVGMSNLGFQTVYRLINDVDHIVCERAFLPEQDGGKIHRVLTVESQTPIEDFDIIAFSISYENDVPAVLTILETAGLPLSAARRGATLPLVLAGGVFCFLNPEPLAPFIDAFLLGEAEALIHPVFEILDPRAEKRELLMALAREVPGVYVPAFYTPRYHGDGTLAAVDPAAGVPATVKRVMVPDLSTVPTASTILTPDTTFENTYLIEVSRGCPHGCRFCSAGYVYRPPRFRPLNLLDHQVDEGCALTDRIGLVGAAVSDLPGIRELCSRDRGRDIHFAFSSLRADALDGPLIEALRKSRVKTATIAPDAGSERMRRVINKGVTEDHVLTATETLVAAGIPNLKVYFMIGLPTETDDDVTAIVDLVKRIKHRFLKTSRGKGHMGEITVSVSCFVPKPFTPFQWAAMDEVRILKRKIKVIQSGLRKTANVRVHADVPRWAYLQALIARGDRRVAEILLLAHRNRGNWPQTYKASAINPHFYVHREREPEEHFPWEFIDQGIDRAYLLKEYRQALDARPSAPCPADPSRCSICGVCKGTAVNSSCRNRG
ncbi:radical SAM protein [Desulfosarcina ovata]|uniref:Radical SAM protein n=1 Tax=Desulfosarcina ovata subsp. ovata TaxID=2752305 RepID=A0A5K8AG20_9BACT|nr:radical SAM protein [Desulfosarcina ovata]BBO91642.1 radical SAM protein [Desulfosarcina ovata subsp. ovata]